MLTSMLSCHVQKFADNSSGDRYEIVQMTRQLCCAVAISTNFSSDGYGWSDHSKTDFLIEFENKILSEKGPGNQQPFILFVRTARSDTLSRVDQTNKVTHQCNSSGQ